MQSFPRNELGQLIKIKKQFKPDKDIFYEFVNFKQVLTHYYPAVSLAVTIDYRAIEKRLKAKYGDARDSFFKKGVLKTFNLTELLYYQEDTGIDGPKFHNQEDPVSVIRYNDSFLLWEGYHRALIRIVNRQSNIPGYTLEL